MPQHDMILDNASGAAFRADANNALAALGSTMKGPNAPPAPIAGMMWLDDDTPSASVWTLKLYDGADWISIATFNISANTWAPVITLLALGAGSAAAPALTFGDTDTGIYSGGANNVDFAANGERIFNLTGAAGSSFALLDNALGAFSSTFYFRTKDASGSVARASTIGTVNENFVSVSSVTQNVAADGSTNIVLAATPAGSRASDRRADRVTIPGSGAIALVGPVNVSSGDLDVAGNLRFNSGYGSAALAFGVRAWVNFNGTGTVAIRGSGGVTSITDNGTGDYTVNFNFTMPGTNYAATVSAGSAGTAPSANAAIAWPAIYSTTSLRIGVSDNNTDTNVDVENMNVIVVR
jgi:hypothetical protein